MDFGRHGARLILATAVLASGGAIGTAGASAELIAPQAASPQTVTPHAVASPESSESTAAPTPVPEIAGKEGTLQANPATTYSPVGAKAGVSPDSPSGQPQDRGCFGQPGCRPCPGSSDCWEPDPRDVLRPPESMADRDRRAICAGSEFAMLYVWGDFVFESYISGRHLEVSRLHLKPQSVLYSLPPEAENLVQLLVRNWNFSCATWVSP